MRCGDEVFGVAEGALRSGAEELPSCEFAKNTENMGALFIIIESTTK